METERLPDLRGILDTLEAGWRSQAACVGQDRLFLSDKNLGRPKNLGSPTVVLALLTCSTCPVRRECLTEALRDVRLELDPASDDPSRPSASLAADGIWGGTLTVDRIAVHGLPRDVALAMLERTFPARLRRQVAAFRRRVAVPGRRWVARDRLILKMLEEGPLAVTRRCRSCGDSLPALARSDAVYCGVRCRVAAHRARAA